MVSLKTIYLFSAMISFIAAVIAIADISPYLQPHDTPIFTILTGLAIFEWSRTV